MMCDIGIIGGSGFIGANLLSFLESAKEVSLRDAGWRNSIIDKNILINLIGKAHDHKGTATEQDYYVVNVDFTKEIFNAFKASSASLLIHVSSLAAIEEYEAVEPLKETGKCKPVSWYGKSKRAAEEWLLKQDLPEGKKLIILRPPMIHGSGDKGSLGLLFRVISKGIPYPLSSFKNERSFIAMDNFQFFVEEIIKGKEKLSSGIYHIADDEAVSTTEIIDIIKSVTGKKVPDIAVPKFLIKGIARIGDYIPIYLNNKRLKKMTGTLLVSNAKIKAALGIEKLPVTARNGLYKTIQSFEK